MTEEFKGFELVRHGYDRAEVDAYLRELHTAARTPRPAFRTRWRGYDPAQVDARIAALVSGS